MQIKQDVMIVALLCRFSKWAIQMRLFIESTESVIPRLIDSLVLVGISLVDREMYGL